MYNNIGKIFCIGLRVNWVIVYNWHLDGIFLPHFPTNVLLETLEMIYAGKLLLTFYLLTESWRSFHLLEGR